MYNTLIALGAAAVTYLLSSLVAGWIAGFLPAVLVLGIVWFLLARRTGQRVQAVMATAMEHAQAQRMDDARRVLTEAMPLGQWQYLVTEQIELQLGSLDYLEAAGLGLQKQVTASKAAFANAKAHFEVAAKGGWRRLLLGWQPTAMLACSLHREGRSDDALKLLATASTGRTDPVFWGLYAWMLNENRRRDEALQVLGRGLKEHAKSPPLLTMQEALSNKKRPDMMPFGEQWYAFFPEDMRNDPKVIELAKAQQARQQAQAPRRPPPGKTWPQPRR